MKGTATGSITVVIELDRGEWTMKANGWSIVKVSFTVRKRPDGTWSVRINHSDFKACERRWTVKTHEVYAANTKFPGFYPRREDLPSSVVTALYDAYSAFGPVPAALPPLEEGKWSES